MTNDDEIVNKIAQSGLVNLNLEDYYDRTPIHIVDIVHFLYEGVMLREKFFRETLLTYDWQQHQDAYVGIVCSEEAIIPMWAYMLLSNKLQPYSKLIVAGDKHTIEAIIWQKTLQNIPTNDYKDKRVLVKGCGKIPIPAVAYTYISSLLTPVVKSLFFGEACSNVPIYKQKTNS